MKNIFGMKDPAKQAGNELVEARLQLLQAEAALEHYTHNVAMLNARIARLERRAEYPAHQVAPPFRKGVESQRTSTTPWPNGSAA